jgi:hypothetical protein
VTLSELNEARMPITPSRGISYWPSETFNNKEIVRGRAQLPEPYGSLYVRRELEESSTKDVSARFGLE